MCCGVTLSALSSTEACEKVDVASANIRAKMAANLGVINKTHVSLSRSLSSAKVSMFL